MMDVARVEAFAQEHGLWVVEDAAHAFPAAWRASAPWQRCGEGTSAVSCFSFYANKTITTGEGGMAVTEDAGAGGAHAADVAARALAGRLGALLGGRSWDYRIVAPGYKYNLTDVAAAIGIHQLERAESMRVEREGIARRYREALADLEEVGLPAGDADRIHSWHLFPIRLRLERLSIDRNAFMDGLKAAGVGCSVHWRPLHLHPYYEETFGWRREDLPVATREWERLVSLPIFPGMREGEIAHVVETVKGLCRKNRTTAQVAQARS